MPNWIEGTLKVRSKDINDIKNFIKNAFEYTCYNCKDRKNIACDYVTANNVCPHRKCFGDIITIEEDGYEANSCEVTCKDQMYLTGSQRVFVGKEKDEIYNYLSNENNILILPFQAAWCIHTEDFTELSKEYNVDIRLYGFEMGMQFCQEIEIINGTVTLEKTIKYNDWDWECPMPTMGG